MRKRCEWCGEPSSTIKHPDYFVCQPRYDAWVKRIRWKVAWVREWGWLGGWFMDDYIRGNWPRTKPGSEVDPL